MNMGNSAPPFFTAPAWLPFTVDSRYGAIARHSAAEKWFDFVICRQYPSGIQRSDRKLGVARYWQSCPPLHSLGGPSFLALHNKSRQLQNACLARCFIHLVWCLVLTHLLSLLELLEPKLQEVKPFLHRRRDSVESVLTVICKLNKCIGRSL